MDVLTELRAQLVRQHADLLAAEYEFNQAPVGTQEYGQARRKVQQLQHDVKSSQQRLKSLLTGSQSSLL